MKLFLTTLIMLSITACTVPWYKYGSSENDKITAIKECDAQARDATKYLVNDGSVNVIRGHLYSMEKKKCMHRKGWRVGTIDKSKMRNSLNEYEKRKIEELSQTIKRNPSDAKAYYDRGFRYKVIKQYDLAIGDFSKSINLKPDYSDAFRMRGLTYYKKDEFDLALNDISKAIELKPKESTYYIYRSKIYSKKGAYDKALTDANKSIELNPIKSRPYRNRAKLYLHDLDNPEKGCADLKKACELGNCKYYKKEIEKHICSVE